ncbi:hypothetical protein HYH03_001898 [Edaphochlamys debaryana]|uniref:Uncharacterized protein n=1 Tax=Edaphochlamys debaryana TaxID=47281 RepID=A0A836C638_9CHLO|nr:hypothetical protein HYH03_001898 [Edaphochlamys debaryana]|eukprot:KAG2500322.1 hypothetical protein HYH03_001898 [Edaphochlamys debaryana]
MAPSQTSTGEQQTSTSQPSGLLMKLGLTCSAAIVAEAVTYPVDMVKTRLQLQGELGRSAGAAAAASLATKGSGAGGGGSRPVASTSAAAVAPKPYGAVRTALELVRREGARGLYAGLSPALVRHIFYTGTRISVYEQLRSMTAAPSTSSVGGASSSGSAPAASAGLGTKLLMGLTAGAVGQAVAVPADLVKVRMQAEGRLVASGQLAAPRYRGMADCLRQTLAQGGVAGLWRGGGPAIQRAALVNLGELATYDQAKQAVLASGVTGGDNLAAHTLSSITSGFFASVASVPADVVKTRMMSQDPAAPLYRSSLDCLVKSVRAEGLMALYKGFFPTWARLGPWQLVFWTSYERMRKACDLGGF